LLLPSFGTTLTFAYKLLYLLKLCTTQVSEFLLKLFSANIMRFLSSFSLLACFAAIAAGAPHEISARVVSPDNTCGKNGTGGGADGYSCPSNLPCCSVNGFCGSTNEYCLTTMGCQAAFGNCTAPSTGTISPDMTCGITGGGTAGYTCPSGASCCSGA